MARLDWYIRANLKPRHLQLLVGLDDLRHVGRVAELMNVSQPAISKALAEIERGLDLHLFERGKNGLVPTIYGECLIGMCRSMLLSLDTAGEELRHLQSGISGRVRVGILPIAAPVLVPRAVLRLREQAPHAAVVLHEAMSDRLLPLLREGHIDLMVGTLPPTSLRGGLEVQVLHRGEGAVIVCGTTHPLASRTRVRYTDLRKYPLVIPPTGVLFRDVVERVMDSLNLPMSQIQVESGSMTATNTMLRESDLIGFYAPHLASHYARLGWLKVLPIEVPSTSVPIGCAWSKYKKPNTAMKLLVSHLQDVARETLGDDDILGQDPSTEAIAEIAADDDLYLGAARA